MTVQFSLWDQFKELQIMKASQRSHLAKAVAHLISSKALSLSVFKVSLAKNPLLNLISQCLR